MAHGGARNGAGRKSNGHKEAQAAAALAYEKEGIMPLPFFLGEMRRLVAEGKPKEAFPYAREALPYCHRKLPGQLNVDVNIESRAVAELIVTTREQADAALAALSDSSGVPRQ